jgi:hypothetical protein
MTAVVLAYVVYVGFDEISDKQEKRAANLRAATHFAAGWL